MKFEKGKKYLCIKDMLDDFERFEFKRGNVYLCVKDDTIQDERKNNRIYLSYFDKYFEPYNGQELPELSRTESIWIARDKKKREDIAYGNLYMYTSKPEWDESVGEFHSEDGQYELYLGLYTFIKDGECVKFTSK